jgi:GMP synthase-like glutamine amidotransferase
MKVIRPDLGQVLPDDQTLRDEGHVVVVLGGSMDVPDAPGLPWMVGEMEWVERIVRAGDIPTLGICLGAQMIASVLGGEVADGPFPERGWRQVFRSAYAGFSFPDQITVFESHRQVFTPPGSAVTIAGNDAWEHQAFTVGEACIGVQFHPEFDQQIVQGMVERAAQWSGPFVQDRDLWLADPDLFTGQHALLFNMLDHLRAIGD